MSGIKEIQTRLRMHAVPPEDRKVNFFKTGKGEYAEHDQFLGVSVPILRRIAKEYLDLPLNELALLLASPMNEERLFALLILVHRYEKKDEKEMIYQFYMKNRQYVNNWNLVDASAHFIVGAHLIHTDKAPLLSLATSSILWERRIAIVATWYFIRQGQLEWTFHLSTLLLHDEHDLIHKAVGWMLREAGKRDVDQLRNFLSEHAPTMPRIMLRYAIEKLDAAERKKYLLAQHQ